MRSAQALEMLNDDARQIKKGLGALDSSGQKKYPRIENLRSEAGGILGVMHVLRPLGDDQSEHLVCGFKFIAGKKLLYVTGRKDARDVMLDEFEKVDQLKGLVRPHMLDNRYITSDVLGRLRRQHKGNFIKKISCEFGIEGIKYHNTTPLYKLDYQLIHDTCASTHQSFDKFVTNAMSVKVRFGIRALLSYIVRTGSRDKPASLNMALDSSLSVYTDLEAEAWYDILDYVL